MPDVEISVGLLYGLWQFEGFLIQGRIARHPVGTAQSHLREYLHFGQDGTFFFAKYLDDAPLAWDADAARFVSPKGAILAHGTWVLKGNRLVESMREGGSKESQENVLTIAELTAARLVIVEPTPNGSTLQAVYDRDDPERYPSPSLQGQVSEERSLTSDPDTARAYLQQAQQSIALLIGQQQFNSAHRLAQQALRLAEDVFGADHQNTAACLVTVGACLSKVNEHAAAVVALERAHQIYVLSMGPQHLLTASALNNLAVAYRAESRWREAVDAALRAVDVRLREGLTAETATSIQNLGLALSGLGLVADSAIAYLMSAEVFASIGADLGAEGARRNLDRLIDAQRRDRRFTTPVVDRSRPDGDTAEVVGRLVATCAAMLQQEPDRSLFALTFGRAAHLESYQNRIGDIRREQATLKADLPDTASRIGVLRQAQTRLLDDTATPRVWLGETLKRVDPAALGPKARAALACGFPNFDGASGPERDQALRGFGIAPDAYPTFADHLRRHADSLGYTIRAVEQQFRRFSGDRNLPRGRYFTVCEDQTGDDRQTLCRELFEYVDSRIPGLVFVSDSFDKQLMLLLAAKGFRLTAPDAQFLIAMFVAPPGDDERQAYRHFLGPLLHTLYGPFESAADLWLGLTLVIIPTRSSRVAIDGVVDLRQRNAQSWLFRFFQHGDGAVSIRPESRAIAGFADMLPALMYPEYGGSGLTKSLGSWMRVCGVQGLVFPSARSNASVSAAEDSSIAAFHGWNFVDYRDVDCLPDSLFHVENNDWYGFTERGGVTPSVAITDRSWSISGIETKWQQARALMLTLLATSR